MFTSPATGLHLCVSTCVIIAQIHLAAKDYATYWTWMVIATIVALAPLLFH